MFFLAFYQTESYIIDDISQWLKLDNFGKFPANY